MKWLENRRFEDGFDQFCQSIHNARMPSPSEQLIAHLEQNRVALRRAVDSIPASLRERRPGADRWSVAEVLEHLAIVERRIAGRMADALAKAKNGTPAPSQPGALAPIIDPDQVRRLGDRTHRFKTSEASEPKGKMNAEEAWTELQSVRDDVVKLVRESDPFPLEE